MTPLPHNLNFGLANAAGHLIGSMVKHPPLAGLLRSPVLLIAGSRLLWAALPR